MLRLSVRSTTQKRAFIKGALFLALLALAAVGARAAVNPATVNPPDTPAGHVSNAFFDAFNTANHDRITTAQKLAAEKLANQSK
jgi:hypothetical protein